MKKALLFSILIFFTTLSVYAYETIIIKYPPGEKWEKAYYKKVGNEAIIQYVPAGQSHENWKRTIIIHSYNNSGYPINVFMINSMTRMKAVNPTGNYSYLKSTPNDSIVTRCTDAYKGVEAQCEFFRGTRIYSGIASIHYINKDKDDFLKNYHKWYDVMKKSRYYNSYYRDERTFDKSEYFEL